jgi:alkylhydroperoxidase family enzyme
MVLPKFQSLATVMCILPQHTLFYYGRGESMPRLRQIRKADAHESARKVYELLFGDRDPVDHPGTATGTPGNWWTVFAGAPDIFDHAVAGFQLYRSPRRKLSPALRELGQMRAGWARGSQFVYSQHCKAARSVGIGEEKIRAIPAWQVADCFSAEERAVLAYTDALVYDGGRVADGVFAALKEHLSDEQILELTYVTALYDLHAVISRALKLEYDDVTERVVEVDAPKGASSDVMAMVDKRES